MRRTIRYAAGTLTLAGVLTLTGCGPYPQGPAGRVTDRGQKHDPATHATRFELTVRTTAGTRQTFQVDVDDFDSCPPDSAYPTCADGN
jgi:hypothetical protein